MKFSIQSNPKFSQEARREILTMEGETAEEVRERVRPALAYCGIDPDFVLVVPVTKETARLIYGKKGRLNQLSRSIQ